MIFILNNIIFRLVSCVKMVVNSVIGDIVDFFFFVKNLIDKLFRENALFFFFYNYNYLSLFVRCLRI